jgi:hypothetical protein
MSVTFALAFDESAPRVWKLECADGVVRDQRRGEYGEIALLIAAHGLTCENEDCRDFGPTMELDGDFGPEVNVTNVNARLLLEDALGLEVGDLTGSCEAGEFLGRVLLALAIAPADAGVPMHQLVAGESTMFGEVREGGATFIDCGRREGYLQDRLIALKEVAQAAIEADRPVTWA